MAKVSQLINGRVWVHGEQLNLSISRVSTQNCDSVKAAVFSIRAHELICFSQSGQRQHGTIQTASHSLSSLLDLSPLCSPKLKKVLFYYALKTRKNTKNIKLYSFYYFEFFLCSCYCTEMHFPIGVSNAQVDVPSEMFCSVFSDIINHSLFTSTYSTLLVGQM